jgi:hypothetical protein
MPIVLHLSFLMKVSTAGQLFLAEAGSHFLLVRLSVIRRECDVVQAPYGLHNF